MKSKKALFIFLMALLPVAACLTRCFTPTKADPRGTAYAGAASCMKCHGDIYRSYLHTAHMETSSAATAKNVLGSFAAGANTFDFTNGQKVVMQVRDSGLYQTGYVNGRQTETHRFDITIGGIRAQTYLYWQGSKLFELPMSYFNILHGWVNSPGYAKDVINFGRPIVTRCLECHTSYVNQLPHEEGLAGQPEFDRNTLIYGIDCERCHGPGAQHVEYHTDNPTDKKAHFMVSYASLSREQKLNSCAVCHGGNKDKFELSAFDFKPGDTLEKFKLHDYFPNRTDAASLDVHGNQNGLLSASKCFVKSRMDCTTCHNTHATDRGNEALYVQKCLVCHNAVSHNECTVKNVALADKAKCIDCHMPLQTSNAINVRTASERDALPYQVHTHRIAIYPEEVQQIKTFVKTIN